MLSFILITVILLSIILISVILLSAILLSIIPISFVWVVFFWMQSSSLSFCRVSWYLFFWRNFLVAFNKYHKYRVLMVTQSKISKRLEVFWRLNFDVMKSRFLLKFSVRFLSLQTKLNIYKKVANIIHVSVFKLPLKVTSICHKV
jgi:hypothetical protein